MAFPAVQTKTTTANSAATSPFNLNLPASIAANDILIMILARQGGAQTYTFPAGWTLLANHAANSSATIGGIYWKIADGTEGATISVSSTIATSQKTNASAYRISGGLSVEISAAFDGTGTPPDPPSLTPSWGADDTLWVALCYSNPSNAPFVSYPTNYASDQQNVTTAPNVASATRQLNATSEDPGTFGWTTNSSFSAYTLAVKPSVSAASDTLFAQACL